MMNSLHTVDTSCFPYIYEQNVDIPLPAADNSGADSEVVRANIYRPKNLAKYPALVTYGPYGKDVHYSDFNGKSFAEVNPRQKSLHSSWETPDPLYWTSQAYAVLRVDERGTGQSPGIIDTMGRSTADAFYHVIEWVAQQDWCNGKVGLLGISYFAATQWAVAAKRPRGLAAIIPWEGTSDPSREAVRHGGILSNTFTAGWWETQVLPYQYGRPGRALSGHGPDTIEGDLSEHTLEANRVNDAADMVENPFSDQSFLATKQFDLENIEVPLLSVANWGGIHLHLRGNVLGFMHAGSKFKYLRFITGRHDLPFYYDEEVAVQKSFLDAFLKGQDPLGWATPGIVPSVDLCIRKGNPPVNDTIAERSTFFRRTESEWPLSRTKYTRYHLSSSGSMGRGEEGSDAVLSYEAPNGTAIRFASRPFTEETEITGHPTCRLSVSLARAPRQQSIPSDIDLFLTLRHLDKDSNEIFYTGTMGEPTPIVKGWLRVSLRRTDNTHAHHREYLPYRGYASSDVQPVELGNIYTVDVELWPTNVIISPGHHIVLEIAAHDTQGCGVFLHNDPKDRPEGKLKGFNKIHFGKMLDNFVSLPIIPKA